MLLHALDSSTQAETVSLNGAVMATNKRKSAARRNHDRVVGLPPETESRTTSRGRGLDRAGLDDRAT